MLGLHHQLRADSTTNGETVQDITGLTSILATASGLSLIIQGQDIWALGVYDTAKTLPGSPGSWGIISVLAGVIMFAGMYLNPDHKASDPHRRNRHLMKLGLGVGGAWNFFFAISFMDEAYKGNIAWQPVFVYVFLMCVYGVLFYTYKGSNAIQRTSP